ncbi:hypothetical protein [Endozoicomonas sp. SESOKO1]|uniref:hypothetical protein n=1 Tax=Endozoicomonas sp. SESOKO1 TaxID=2828742 RepID=UPI0021486D42|nr:hypothetical protein [Endozoicomonas sp. SESOKO1]
MTDYNASSIKILSEKDIQSKFLWKKAQSLAEEYSVPIEILNRAAEASMLLGMDLSYYEQKYLLKEPVETNSEFTEVYTDLMRQRRR